MKAWIRAHTSWQAVWRQVQPDFESAQQAIHFLGLGIFDPERLLHAVAEMHCRPLNVMAISRRAGMARATVLDRIADLIRAEVVSLLPPYPLPPFTRSFRSPKLIVRQAGLFLRLMGVTHPEIPAFAQLARRAFCGFMTDRILSMEVLAVNPVQPYHCTGYYGRAVDLIVVSAGIRIGYSFPRSILPHARDWEPLRYACSRGTIDRGLLIHPGDRAFILSPNILALPAPVFLKRYPFWSGKRERWEMLEAVRQPNLEMERRAGSQSGPLLAVGCEERPPRRSRAVYSFVES